ncbi:hypothetical protein BJX64DRAFT_254770 [Aspergillus heterothallicus]
MSAGPISTERLLFLSNSNIVTAMATHPFNMSSERQVEIKREREASVELGTSASPPPSTRLSDNTRPSQQTSSSNSPRSTKSSMIRVTVESRDASKPVPFPLALNILLEEWHEKKGRELPPCKYYYTKRGRGSAVAQAYDRKGAQVKMTEFSVLTPVAYGVLVAQYPDNSMKLVASVFSGSRKYGSYYRAWLGIEKGFEHGASIVRHFGNLKAPDVSYRPEAWLALSELLEKEQPKKGQPASTIQDVRSSPLSGTRKRTATQGSIPVFSAKKRQIDQQADSSSGSEETDSSSGDEETDEEETDEGEIVIEKKVITEPKSLATRKKDNESEPNLPSTPELRFKLTFFKFRVQNVREFPVDECRTGKELFEKARSFFLIFDDTIQVDILSCQIATRSDQHYIFAGNEGEFNILLQQAQEIAKGLGKPLTIEVSLVRP